jgi:hypothetical protein
MVVVTGYHIVGILILILICCPWWFSTLIYWFSSWCRWNSWNHFNCKIDEKIIKATGEGDFFCSPSKSNCALCFYLVKKSDFVQIIISLYYYIMHRAIPKVSGVASVITIYTILLILLTLQLISWFPPACLNLATHMLTLVCVCFNYLLSFRNLCLSCLAWCNKPANEMMHLC